MQSISLYNLKSAIAAGGVSGSKQVLDFLGDLFQLKPSILINPDLLRRVIAGNTDQDNFGEVIAACIGRAFLGEEGAPEVSLVYDDKRKCIWIASKYLKGDSIPSSAQDLDKYSGIALPSKKKHVTFFASETTPLPPGSVLLDSDKMSGIKQSLANAVVLSAVLGDHDINPGNMLAITKGSETKVARIDFGHAFLGLIAAPKRHGGQLEDAENPILDFFNRKYIAGIAGDPSKLWRDYPGLVPSQEIVDALRMVSENYESKIVSGLTDAKKKFSELIEILHTVKDTKSIAHVKKSLCAIYVNLGGQNPRKLLRERPANLVNKVFEEIERFVKKNCENTRLVANVMQLQLHVDRALKEGTPLPNGLIEKEFPMKAGEIQWPRTQHTPPFSGSFQKYIGHRTNELGQMKGADRRSYIHNYRKLRDEALQQKVPPAAKSALELVEDYFGSEQNVLGGKFQKYLDERKKVYWFKDLCEDWAALVLGCFGFKSDHTKREDYLSKLKSDVQLYKQDPANHYDDLCESMKQGYRAFSPRANYGDGDKYASSLQATLWDFQYKLSTLNGRAPSTPATGGDII